MDIAIKLLQKDVSKEFVRFIIVGIFNTSINYGVYLFLLVVLNIAYFISGGIGFLAGALTGFFLNRFWTFKSRVSIATGSVKYLLVQIFCLGVHVGTQIGVTHVLMVPEVYSQIPGIAVTTVLNFTISRKIVFGQR